MREPRGLCVLFKAFCFGFEGRLDTLCRAGIFELHSFSGSWLLPLCAGIDCPRELKSGIRLELQRPLCGSDVVFAAGRLITWEPSDGGCDIQSSDNESSQAFSIVERFDSLCEKGLGDRLFSSMTSLRFVYGCGECVVAFNVLSKIISLTNVATRKTANEYLMLICKAVASRKPYHNCRQVSMSLPSP